jgi:hypothetical protein|tara:strand:+ start:1695 stop:1925 length:231 start_codon:yes stop_codon:yes gene_type:complete
MDKIVEVVVALCMFYQGGIIEHTYKDSMSDCLKSKRIATREVNPNNVRFACGKVKAETEIYMGEKKILKIIEDKYE